MSLLSVNMAIPFGNNNNRNNNNNNNSNRDSQIYFLSNPQIEENQLLRRTSSSVPIIYANQKKYLIFKLIQFILILSSLFILICGIHTIKIIKKEDLLTCAIFGALLFYAMIFILFNFNVNQKPSYLLTINSISTMFLFIISVNNFTNLMNKQIILDKLQEMHPEKKFLLSKDYIALNLANFIFTFMNCLIYLAETIIVYLEIKGYI